MFFKGSRYKNIPEYSVMDASGKVSKAESLRWIPDTSGTFMHTIKESDRLDLLAYKYYGDAKKWWLICDANSEVFLPLDLLKEPGKKIIIPPNRMV